MRTLVVPAPAKLNLFLHVVGRRQDGYHELESLIVLLGFGDTLTLSMREDGLIRRTNGIADLPAEEDLCVRAARLLQRTTGCSRGVDIVLDKRIPMGSGLGGGSSDAASTLLALNRLWNARLSRAELIALGTELGADVPYFLFGVPALARGIGERLTALTSPGFAVVVAVPPVVVPTKEIFSTPDLARCTPRTDLSVFPPDYGRNDLQPVACARYPLVADTLADLDRALREYVGHAPYAARMSGSGAASFVLLPDAQAPSAGRIAQALSKRMREGGSAFATQTLARHPLYEYAQT